MKKINVGIVGAFQNGKSTLVNCLLGLNIAPTGGFGLKVTTYRTLYLYGEELRVSYLDSRGEILHSHKLRSISDIEYRQGTESLRVECPSPLLRNINLIDTPGFNANDEDDRTALNAIYDFDMALVLVKNKTISTFEKAILSYLKKVAVPFFLVINCMDEGDDLWNPESELNSKIAESIISDLELTNLRPISVMGRGYICVNAIWYWHSISYHENSPLFKKQRNRIINFLETFYERPAFSRRFLANKSGMMILNEIFVSKNVIQYFHLLSFLYKELMNYHCELYNGIKNTIEVRNHSLEYNCKRLNSQIEQNNKKIVSNKSKIEELSNKLHELSRRSVFSTDDWNDGFSAVLLRTAGRIVSRTYHAMTKIPQIGALEENNKLMVLENEASESLITYIRSLK